MKLRIAYVFELNKTEIAEIGHGEMSRLDGDDELHELHRLRAHQIHRRTTSPFPLPHLLPSDRINLSLSRNREEKIVLELDDK